MTEEVLVGQLRRLGVAIGDRLMVHASMRAVGCRAEAVISSIDAAVGEQGTWMMTLGALDEWGWVNTHPESERAELLAGTPVFDPLDAPADPDVGVLAEVFRTTPGTHVSDHPEGRFGARGRLAATWTSDVPWNDYYGTGSPLERFIECGGRILRLGADDDTVTLIHYAEFLAPLAGKVRVRRHRRVQTPVGPQVRVVETLDDSDGIVEYRDIGDVDEFAVILRQFRDTGAIKVGRVGGADAELFDGRALVDFAVEWIVTHALPVEGTVP